MDPLAAKPKLRRVPENLLKKRKLHEIRRAREAKKIARKEKRKRKTKILSTTIKTGRFIRAEEFIKKRRMMDADQTRLEIQARTLHSFKFQISDDSKIALVIRVKSDKWACRKVKILLTLLRLRTVNSAVFLEITPLTKQMLSILEPYLVWGFPNLKTIRDLIAKRGSARVNKCRVPLSDNIVVEDNLGQYNLICVEDLINEIFTVGPHFKEATKFLWPFQFQPMKQRYSKSEQASIGDGQFGFRGTKVNEFIEKWI